MASLSRTLAALVAVLALTLTGCGDDDTGSDDAASAAPSPTGDAVPEGEWLLRFGTAEGADGERSRGVYVRVDPATGRAVVRSLPPVTAGDLSGQGQALLVSGDQARSLLDTAVPRSERRSGRLAVHRLDRDATDTVDVRALTGDPDLRPVAAAFDPSGAALLRVVGADGSVWTLDLEAGTVTASGTLPQREGFVFADGFDPNTAEPFLESLESEETFPEGHGLDDDEPVERQGGTLLRYDGTPLPGLPDVPCEFAGAFELDSGDAWLFCADDDRVTAYRAESGAKQWQAVGTPTPQVVPRDAVEFELVLPPVR